MKMKFSLIILVLLIFLSKLVKSEELQTLYEYYSKGGIKSGLEANDGNQFILNGKELTILSGDFHYFRVFPKDWKNRILKMKASGLNTVQFYTVWNLHELHQNQWDFNGILNLTEFLQTIKDMDMFAIIRPGPYICSEWEFGGLPSWLLTDPNMKVRSDYKPFLNATEIYFKQIISIIKPFLWHSNGGPIIAVQLENEFASFGNTKQHKSDENYFIFLKELYIKNGIKELLFTSDNNLIFFQKNGNIPDILMALNSGNPKELEILNKLQPNRPLFIAEFWFGSYYRSGDKYHKRDEKSDNDFRNSYELALNHYNSSVNIYMFSGGTNFGFMNGANLIYNSPLRYHPSVTSYVHDSPISESGDYNPSYWIVKETIQKLSKDRNFPKLKTPEPPKDLEKASYGSINISEFLNLNDLLKYIKPIVVSNSLLKQMESIGQNFGFILYQTVVQKFSKLTIEEVVNDRAIIAINDKNIRIIEDINSKNLTFKLSVEESANLKSSNTLNILVENMGRLNFGSNDELNRQRKGLNGSVFIDGMAQHNWNIYPLQFEDSFLKNLKNILWKKELSNKLENNSYPLIVRAELDIKDEPKDTFLTLNDKWVKGVLFVNDFNVGKFWNIGPQKSFYIPSNLLKRGKNEIYVFDLENNWSVLSNASIVFNDNQVWN